MMKAKELFVLAVRLGGLVFVYHGLSSLPVTVSTLIAAFVNFHAIAILMSIFYMVWPFVAAYWFLRGAPFIVNLAYPDEPKSLGREQTIFGGNDEKRNP